MKVALTMRVTQAPDYHELRDSISHDWMARLDAWGMTPALVTKRSAAEDFLDGLGADLLVLTGGDDLGVTPRRDDTEMRLLAHAHRHDLPVLGVCRGMQLINRHFGGGEIVVEGHVARSHGVTVATPWRGLYAGEASVNSFHSVGIAPDGLGTGLIGAAFDGSGNVEALCHRIHPIAAVMWHPERPGAPSADRTLMEKLATDGVFWT